MTRNIIIRSLIAVGSLLIIVGVSLIGWMNSTSADKNQITVEVEEGNTESVEFKNFELVPGSSCEYTIKFNGERARQYDVTLDFVEKEDKALKNFAYVKIISNNEIIYDRLLADAFEDDVLEVSVDFDNNENTELKIVYYLPIEVGNEAKNAEAVFELQFVTKSEGDN